MMADLLVSEFAYDGANRRTQITERGAGETAVAQPASAGTYSVYTSAPFTAAAGNYTIRFEGLSALPNNVALIDGVTVVNTVPLNDVPVPNGSFEAPSVGANVVPHPVGTTWTFEGSAGIAGNGSGFANAPDGTQVGYVQNNTGVIRQTVALTAGTYALAFKAAQGADNKTPQQVRVTIEKTGLPTTVQRFVWNGNTIAEERDSTGATVTKRYFAEGEWRMNAKGDGKFYYTRDHLGSIREVTNSSGVLQARYDYDVWGNSVVLSGNMNLDFGYTGHYFHAPSGLNLSLYRPYKPALGRWLSRDPIEEEGGINLYGYVHNNSSNLIDPFGLDAATFLLPFGWSFTIYYPFTEHPPGEVAHERQHRDDWYNYGRSMPGWKYEQRGYAAAAEYCRKRIAQLEAKKCLTDAEKKELEDARNELRTAEIIANSDAAAQEYYHRR